MRPDVTDFLVDECCQHVVPHLRGHRVMRATKGATDAQLADLACDRVATIVSENKRHFASLFKQRSAQCGGSDRCGYGVLIIPNGFASLNIADVYNRLKLNGKKIKWEDVRYGNLKVSVGTDGKVDVSRLPLCDACRRKQSWCVRCRSLGFTA